LLRRSWRSARRLLHPFGLRSDGHEHHDRSLRQGRVDGLPAANLDDARRGCGLLTQRLEDRPGEVALERTQRFQAALTGLLFALQVGRARGSQRPWTTAILCSAELSCRLPWRLSRWRRC
jgi:hypothetical protein